jgi:hypothetical protein
VIPRDAGNHGHDRLGGRGGLGVGIGGGRCRGRRDGLRTSGVGLQASRGGGGDGLDRGGLDGGGLDDGGLDGGGLDGGGLDGGGLRARRRGGGGWPGGSGGRLDDGGLDGVRGGLGCALGRLLG